LRRIIRRAVRHGNKLGAKTYSFTRLVAALAEKWGAYPELKENKSLCLKRILKNRRRTVFLVPFRAWHGNSR